MQLQSAHAGTIKQLGEFYKKKGQRARLPRALGDDLLAKLAEANQLDPGQLTLLRDPPTPAVAALLEGRIDALVLVSAPESLLVQSGVLKPGDTYAITCGEPMGYPGGTNMLKICQVR